MERWASDDLPRRIVALTGVSGQDHEIRIDEGAFLLTDASFLKDDT